MSTTTVYLELDDGSTYEARLVFHPRLALERVIAIDLALGVPAVRKALHVLVQRGQRDYSVTVVPVGVLDEDEGGAS